MKTMRMLCATVLTIVFATSISAQKMNKEVGAETKINKFSVTSSQGTIDYTVKIQNEWSDYVQTERSREQDQARVKGENYVVSTIQVNDDADHAYDNVITLRYKSDKDDPVKVLPTPTGFDIMVSGEKLNYDFIKQECRVPEGCPIQVELESSTM